jgi:hypothetical protein
LNPIGGFPFATKLPRYCWGASHDLERSKFRGPDVLVFANKTGKPFGTHNLLQRHIKPAAKTRPASERYVYSKSWGMSA